MYKDLKGLVSEAEEKGLSMHRIVLEDEIELTGNSEGLIYERLEQRWQIMVSSALRALNEAQEMTGSLISGQSKKQNSYNEKGSTLSGSYINSIMAMALSSCEINAGMGRICAAPTAGSCGIIPAVMYATSEKLGSTLGEILDSLLVAGGIGAIITKNATVSGAEGGCQAECGAAGAMAAAAAVYLAGGTPEQCENAVGIALMNCMGLVCDPVAGLVQLPCSYRNASQAVNAVISADMALAGQSSVIPADEVIESMYAVGRRLPVELKETALGGIAATPTGKRLKKQIFGA